MHSPLLHCPVRAIARALVAAAAIYCSDGAAFARQTTTQGGTRETSTPPVDVAARAPAEAPLPSFRVYISDARVGIAAVQALHLAAARLARPNCLEILREFTDVTGKPLVDRLAAMRVSAEAYLRLMVVVDGSRLRPCLGTVALAFTVPGSRVVYLCGASFATKLQDSPTEATLTIIHELLHSLGLGENPPSTEAISQRVRQRCW
jgi:hypothetical protein